jgi:PAS domain S-box-containing protein
MSTPLRALLVTDSTEDLTRILRELQNGGYTLTHVCVQTPEEFRAALDSQEWDVILADYSLPQFGAPAALRIVQEYALDAPFIVLSGTVGEEVAVETMRAGAHDYLIKENLRRLVPAIQRELREAATRRMRRQAEADLRESEERFRTLSESAPLGIYLADPQMNCLYVNTRWQEITGRSAEEGLGQGWQITIHPEDVERTRSEWIEFLQREGEFLSHLRILRPDGTLRWVASRAGRIKDAQGNLLGYAGTLEDVTERRLIQEQLLQAQKLESLGRLAGSIAHDFNNFLTAMMGYAEVAIGMLPEQHAIAPLLENVLKAGERAAGLTSQLLAFARKQRISPRVVYLNEVLIETDKILRRLIGEHIELVTLPQNDLGMVRADPGQIQQLLINLAVNARDAMPEGGRLTLETDNVTLDADYARRHTEVQPGDYVLLAVSDTGVGMEESVQQHIFEPFFTTKRMGEGTGLGLAICHSIVKQNGGHIWLYSEPGKGTTFKIYFPRVQEMAMEASSSSRETLSTPRGTETILLVEDNAPLREFALTALIGQGYHVLSASNGSEALEVARAFAGEIHLLVTDVVMPQLGGSELAAQLMVARPSLKTLYISGYTENAFIHQAVQENRIRFLQKPFTALTLLRQVRDALDTSA